MIEIININKQSVPAQDSTLGALTIKTILYKQNDKYCCSQGIGDDEWICTNGSIVSYEHATMYFQNIYNLKNNWA